MMDGMMNDTDECQCSTCEWQNVGECGYCDEHCECGEQDA
jgi:hypothetical protein